MASTPWRPLLNMEVYVVPRTKGAPGVAYQAPRGVVVHVAPPEVTVELGDGTRVTTHERNVRATPPPRVEARPRTLPGRNNAIDPKHGEEMTIFDFLDEETT